jgi:hypothetical protein
MSLSFSDWMQVASAIGGIATAGAVIVAVWTVRASERTQHSLLVQQHIFEYLRLYKQNADLFADSPIYDRARFLRLKPADRRRLESLAVYLIYTCDMLFQVRDPRAPSYLKGLEIYAGPLCELGFDPESIRSARVIAKWNDIRRRNGCEPLSPLPDDLVGATDARSVPILEAAE